MKKLISIICFSLLLLNVYSNTNLNDNSVNCYREALIFFDSNEYGKALNKCEDAIKFRKENIQKELTILQNSLSVKQVQKAGNKITDIIKILNERNEKIPLDIINSYVKLKSLDYFNNSMPDLLEYIKEQEAYPEVHKLMGDIYKLEGEYDFAEQYYLSALDNMEALNIPNDKYELLYLLAEISELQNNKERMEIRYLNILVDDKTYSDKALANAMLNTINSNKNDSFEKFFQLYRADSYFTLKAYYKLGCYYYENNELEKALKLITLSVITGFTKIATTVEKRNINFDYKNFESLLYQVQFYEDIVQWGNENELWSSFNLFASICTQLGYKNFSIQMLKVLAQYSPEEYWQKEAVMQLSAIK